MQNVSLPHFLSMSFGSFIEIKWYKTDEMISEISTRGPWLFGSFTEI